MKKTEADSQNTYSLESILGASLSKEEAIKRIRSDPDAYEIFQTFEESDQQKIIGFIQGNQGLRLLHDNFSQKILNPYLHPERLEHFLSALLGQTVKIKEVLSREGNRLADKGSFVVMDFLVELSDGSIANVEVQRIGYSFPGERSCCYISDAVMRQYNEVKEKQGSKFTFQDLKPVLLIILMESSSKEFLKVAPCYIHRELHSYDSGADITNLSHTIYISLDTFRSVVHNISTELDAWLMFFSSDEPADIVKLVNAYPEFRYLYQDIMEFRREPKELMHMFSEALRIMDRNLEKYMVEEAQKEAEDTQRKLAEAKAALADTEAALADSKAALANSEAALADKDAQIAELEAKLAALKDH